MRSKFLMGEIHKIWYIRKDVFGVQQVSKISIILASSGCPKHLPSKVPGGANSEIPLSAQDTGLVRRVRDWAIIPHA